MECSFSANSEVLEYHNYDCKNLVTPIKVHILHRYLKQSDYDKTKTQALIHGFTKGFDLGYRKNSPVKLTAPNLKITVGSKTELWNKVMLEVKEGRYAGPFDEIPFKNNFIQSPIGLVPKDDGKRTRLIFHLSYPRGKGLSVNDCTLEEFKKVQYKDFDQAIKLCLAAGLGCFMSKSDLMAAFRQLCLARKWWRFLVMKAQHPITKKWKYFFDKCLPFGAAVSCSLFQSFSDALAHIIRWKTHRDNINYLDDFFFVHALRRVCQHNLNLFIQLCRDINMPISLEKTTNSTTSITFLGLLIDLKRQMVFVPVDKLTKAIELIDFVLNKKSRKITLKQLQKLCGYLNFLSKAIVAGRAFTRRLYSFGSALTKPNHHLKVKKEMQYDLLAWRTFLTNQTMCGRPFFHFDLEVHSEDIGFYTDASRNQELGCGGICGRNWFIMQWEEKLIDQLQPSIAFLELYTAAIGILAWLNESLANRKVIIYCDNMSVVYMLNKTSSSCKHCMILIRIIVLHCMIHNIVLVAKHVPTNVNLFADALSRLKYREFWRLARAQSKNFTKRPTPIPEVLTNIDNFLI